MVVEVAGRGGGTRTRTSTDRCNTGSRGRGTYCVRLASGEHRYRLTHWLEYSSSSSSCYRRTREERAETRRKKNLNKIEAMGTGWQRRLT